MRRARPLVLLAALAACGLKGAPQAPELVEPTPPAALSAVSTPEGVRLTWLRPTHYTGGQRMNDLRGFTIERAADEGAAVPFKRVGSVELTDQTRFRQERRIEWTDRSAEPGRRYLYRVVADTLDGYESTPAGPVAVRFGPAPTPDEDDTR